MQNHITLTKLQLLIKETLRGAFARSIWVSAEIAECKTNYSGHCYLELVEKGGDNGVPLSQVRAVIWRNAYIEIARKFESETGQKLTAGMHILANVNINYHELYGFSLQIVALDSTYTLGDMERQRQITITKLKKDGVWEMNTEVEMPILPQRIAIVSSANAAGYRDFVMELERSQYQFQTALYDAFMQGEAAEESIIMALDKIADNLDQYDAVIIIRGGGSTSDLNCFNSYRLCSYVAQFPIPVITGIGHDKDISIADMVANLSLKTPTAVATWLIERAINLDSALNSISIQLHTIVTNELIRRDRILDGALANINHGALAIAAKQEMILESVGAKIDSEVHNFIQNNIIKLDSAQKLVDSSSPRRIMQLGFAIVRGDNGAIMSAKEVAKGDSLTIELVDGVVATEVK